MKSRLIAAATVFALVSACTSIGETGDFFAGAARTANSKPMARNLSPEGDKTAPDGTPDGTTVSGEAKPEDDAPGSDATPTETAGPDPDKKATDPDPAATPATAVAAVAPEKPAVTGIFAFFGSNDPKPAVETAPEAAAAAEAGVQTAALEPAATPAAPAAPDAVVIPTEEAAPEEISEADLAGEVEADPDKIAVPEQPFNDGEAHDFVNVYTSKPDQPVAMIDGLPGVEWPNGVDVASLGGGDDDGRLFGGSEHPFARTVPGIPQRVVQAANGLLLANSSINVDCIKPQLLSLVRRAETNFGKKVVITSGYRSPAHNRRVGGATHSQHMYCNALDLYMPGVARDDLARFFFTQPDRGGLGLYCHTRSIHVDTGKRRQWRWSCRRGRG